MKTQILYFWLLPLEGRQRTRRKSRWRMSEADAARQYPGADRIEVDTITIQVPETPEEKQAAYRGHGVGFPGPLSKSWAQPKFAPSDPSPAGRPTSAMPPPAPDAESGTPPPIPPAA